MTKKYVFAVITKTTGNVRLFSKLDGAITHLIARGCTGLALATEERLQNEALTFKGRPPTPPATWDRIPYTLERMEIE